MAYTQLTVQEPGGADLAMTFANATTADFATDAEAGVQHLRIFKLVAYAQR